MRDGERSGAALVPDGGLALSGGVRRQRTVGAESFARLLGLLAGLVFLAALLVASVRIGAVAVSWHDVWAALFHYDANATPQIIVRALRLPRSLLAIEVGGALALAGALMQGVTRNPLADAGLFGLNAGAQFFVVLAIVLFNVQSISVLVWWALPGAAFAVLLVYGLAALGRGPNSAVRMALAGAMTAVLIGSATSLLTWGRLSLQGTLSAWGLGGVGGRSMGVVVTVSPFIVVGLLVGLLGGRDLNGLQLGDEIATAQGQNILRTRLLVGGAVTVLAGASVAATGGIGFLGLAVPHAVRGLVGPDYRWVLPYSAVYGALLLLGCDLLGRIVAGQGEIPVGFVTALIGVPFFIYFARKRRIDSL